MLYHQILSEREFMKKQILSLEKQLSTLPKGNIYCVHDKNQLKWFHHNETKTKYLTKKEQPLKEALAYKKYLSLLLKDYYKELSALDSYLKHYKNGAVSNAEDFLSCSEYKNLLPPSLISLNEELVNWANAPYDKCTQHPEHLIFPSISGNIVRSKSESMIDMLLYQNQIPFRYECALGFPECTIFPDFTIRHPITGKTYYWEHFGLIDDLKYSKNAYSKLQLFISHNIIPGDNLIMTFETKDYQLTASKINEIIKYYFL